MAHSVPNSNGHNFFKHWVFMSVSLYEKKLFHFNLFLKHFHMTFNILKERNLLNTCPYLRGASLNSCILV